MGVGGSHGEADHKSFSGEELEETPKHISLQEFTEILGMIWVLPVRSTGMIAELSWISGARRPRLSPEPILAQRASSPTPILPLLTAGVSSLAGANEMFTEKISLSVEPGQMAIDPLLSVIPIPSETRCGSKFPLTQNSGWGLRLQAQPHTGRDVRNVRKSLRLWCGQRGR